MCFFSPLWGILTTDISAHGGIICGYRWRIVATFCGGFYFYFFYFCFLFPHLRPFDEVQVYLDFSSFLDNIRVPLVSTCPYELWLFFLCLCNFVPNFLSGRGSVSVFTFSFCRVDVFGFGFGFFPLGIGGGGV
jgi:hypothetical protein